MVTRGWSFQELTGSSSATFSVDLSYRYSLTRTWNEALPRLTFVGLNPSTADSMVDDPTIRRILGFARRWGCGSLMMLNLFAFRSPDPKKMRAAQYPIGIGNDAAIVTAFLEAADPEDRFKPRGRLVLGWGSHGCYHDNRGYRVACWAKQIHGAPECFGLTQNGQPRHPLYLASDSETVLWEP